MGKQPHTATARGRMVRVTLKTGETFEAKFIDRTPKKWLIFDDGRRVRAGDVKSFSDRRLLQPLSRHAK